MNFFTLIFILFIIALVIGAILGFASIKLKVESDPISEKIDAILPQTQCAQCGYPGCKPYADALASNEKDITKCTPGGIETIIKIAEILEVEVPNLDDIEDEGELVAFIDEVNCIGCTKCIQACPVDAIIGTNKATHTVIKELCTGCKLCVAPCPTDCIVMKKVSKPRFKIDPSLTIDIITIKD